MGDPRVRPPTSDEMADLNATLQRARSRLGISEATTPADAVSTTDAFIDSEQIERQKLLKGLYLLFFRNPDSLIDETGAVWGEQLVRAFGWRWQYAVREKEFERAVVSPEESFVVYPGNYIGRMLRPPYDHVTLMLMFNMIQAGKLPESEPGGMEDISDGRLRHIVPKR